MEGRAMELKVIDIIKPDDVNVVLGQSHFIKTVEDVHEALVSAVPGIKFGFAFCEASGKRLIRWTGTDPAMIALARSHALTIGAGHCLRWHWLRATSRSTSCRCCAPSRRLSASTARQRIRCRWSSPIPSAAAESWG